MKRIRLALVTVRSATGEVGGAERFFNGLCHALNFDAVQTDEIPVVGDESNETAILKTYLRFHELDVSRYDGVITTKAPAYMVRHPNHVCYLQHTMRVFYDMFDREFPRPSDELREFRAFIHRADTAALSAPHTRKLFAIGEEVRQRLLKFNGLQSTVLKQALERDCFIHDGDEGYAFLPSRLHRWKRVDLIVRAMRHVSANMPLLIAGTGEDEAQIRAIAEGDARIRFLGRVSDEELVKLYSRARFVPFTPIHEDFGYVTLEAFQSGKPVITCTDSGEPARMVREGVSGRVVAPEAEALGLAMESLYCRPEEAAAMGQAGAEFAKGIQWETVRTRLLGALGF